MYICTLYKGKYLLYSEKYAMWSAWKSSSMSKRNLSAREEVFLISPCMEGFATAKGFSYRRQELLKGNEYLTMRTYTHGVIGYLLYAKRSQHE